MMSAIGLPAPGREHRWFRLAESRGVRVLVLLLAVLLMSLADLSMTLTHLTTVGMLESNPVARSVMAMGSPWLLAAWKLATLALGLAILYVTRRTVIGEIGAWFCFAVLIWLSIHWVQYNNEIARIGPDMMKYAAASNEAWVAIEPGN